MIRALTVRQPWASAMFRRTAPKDIENRTWRPPALERIAVHAGLRDDPAGVAALGAVGGRSRGMILGTVAITSAHLEGDTLCGVLDCQGNPWAMWAAAGEKPLWHWHIEHPRELMTPIPARGALGLWIPDDSTQYLIEHGELAL